jgi:hypothetical protein
VKYFDFFAPRVYINLVDSYPCMSMGIRSLIRRFGIAHTLTPGLDIVKTRALFLRDALSIICFSSE